MSVPTVDRWVGVMKVFTATSLYGKVHAAYIVSDCQDLHSGENMSPEYGVGIKRERRDILE